MSKSWKLTIVVYAISFAVIGFEMFSGTTFTEEQLGFIQTMLVTLVGSTTAGGTFNAVMKRKSMIKDVLQYLKDNGIEVKPK